MTRVLFLDIVGYKKMSACSVCDSHEYSLPMPITADIEPHLAPLGALKYPLNKVSLIKIENDYIDLQARVGRSVVRVKFKKDTRQRAVLEAQLVAYLSQMMPGTEIIL